ncbi:hypothetical protein D3C72_1152880 [compost metagenome]
MLVRKTLAHVKTDSVNDTRMRIYVIHYNIVFSHQGINDRYHSLVAEIQKISRLFHYEGSKLVFQLLVILGMSAHHTGTHRIGRSISCCCFRICLAYFRVVGQSQIIVKTPVQNILPVKFHSRP